MFFLVAHCTRRGLPRNLPTMCLVLHLRATTYKLLASAQMASATPHLLAASARIHATRHIPSPTWYAYSYCTSIFPCTRAGYLFYFKNSVSDTNFSITAPVFFIPGKIYLAFL